MFMYQDEPDAYEECFECQEKENRIDDVKYWFQAVIDQLFGFMGEYNADELHRYLEELAAVLDMKFPEKELAITAKKQIAPSEPSGISGMLDAWKYANAEYFKSMITKGVNHVSV